jgi:hypothetical protein
MIEPIKMLESMTIKDILIRSYQFYKNNFFKSIGIVLLLKGPYLILAYIISRFAASFFVDMFSLSDGSLANFEYIASVLIVEILDLIFIPFISPISVSAITIFMSEKHLNRDIGILKSYKRVMNRALPLFGTVLLSGLFISSGFIFTLTLMSGSSQLGFITLLISPILASVFWVWFAFVPQTVVIEGEGGMGAMKRSKYLMDGYFRKVLILVVLVFVATLLATWILSFGFSKMLFFLGDSSAFLGKGLSNVVSVILEAFRITIMPMLYFDLRVRKEGFNVDMLDKEMETEI